MKTITTIALLVMLFAAASSAQTTLKIGSPAPAFNATSLDGQNFDLESIRGKVVVIAFWSTRCAICHHELPRLNQLAERFRSDDVVMLALSMENDDTIKNYLRKNTFKFRVAPNSFATVLAYADRSKNGHLDMGFPAFFVIDAEGRIAHRSSGYDKTSAVESTVVRLSQQRVRPSE